MNQIIIDGKTYTLVPVEETQPEPLICTLDGYAYYLGPKADKQMNWQDAIEWASAVGVGYELPSRQALLACYCNPAIRPLFKMNDWYWSSSEFDPNYAWGQYFGDGYQGGHNKGTTNAVRAVRKVKVGDEVVIPEELR